MCTGYTGVIKVKLLNSILKTTSAKLSELGKYAKTLLYSWARSRWAVSVMAGLVLAFPIVSGLQAYERDWQDSTMDGPRDQQERRPDGEEQSNSVFKITGKIWFGFDTTERVNGELAPAGPGSENTGFRMGRIYSNISGYVKDGPYRGFGFRVTPDISRADSLADGCGDDRICRGSNDYIYRLKYAYTDLPIYMPGSPMESGSVTLRLGQQQIPMIEGQAGFSLQRYWDHRYLDNYGQDTWYELGLVPASDIGIGLLMPNDFWGLHVLLANGEGSGKTNAQGLGSILQINDPEEFLTELAYGEEDSYALDLYGMLSFRPTGKNQVFEFAINLPFRLHNVAGLFQDEVEASVVDFSDPADPVYLQYYGDTRAKRDSSYGIEVDSVFHAEGFSLGVGLGAVRKIDQAGMARREDFDLLTGVTTINYGNVSTYIANEEDRIGDARYGFLYLKFNRFGMFFRHTKGTLADDVLDGRLDVVSRKGWFARYIEADQAAGGGALSLDSLSLILLEVDKGQFTNQVFGFSWQFNPRFRAAIGINRITGTDSYGRTLRSGSSDPFLDLFFSGTDPELVSSVTGSRRVDESFFIRTETSF